MKYLNFSILILMMLSACMFSEKTTVEYSDSKISQAENILSEDKKIGDSITVNTMIGDYRLFYKISDVVSKDLIKLDKEIFLNIQKLDVTNVVSYKLLNSKSFKPCLKNICDENFRIDVFYLKEVNTNSIVFGTELCSFDASKRIEVDLLISEDGTIDYKYNGWI